MSENLGEVLVDGAMRMLARMLVPDYGQDRLRVDAVIEVLRVALKETFVAESEGIVERLSNVMQCLEDRTISEEWAQVAFGVECASLAQLTAQLFRERMPVEQAEALLQKALGPCIEIPEDYPDREFWQRFLSHMVKAIPDCVAVRVQPKGNVMPPFDVTRFTVEFEDNGKIFVINRALSKTEAKHLDFPEWYGEIVNVEARNFRAKLSPNVIGGLAHE